MATFLKLLLFGCICLSACTQQNRGVRSADELFKELESAYQKKDSAAFEKFFKEWNEISKDSLEMERPSGNEIQNVYEIMKDLYTPSTSYAKEFDRVEDDNSRYGIVQTSIAYSVQDTSGKTLKRDTLYRFYAETRKSPDSVLYLFPEYAKALYRFVSLPDNENYDRERRMVYWIQAPKKYAFIYLYFYEINFQKNLANARLRYAKSDMLLGADLKKVNGKWIQDESEMPLRYHN
jgi:hypothetical protein